MLFPKGHKLNSILPIKCPQCHKGNFLVHPVYNFLKLTRVRETCEHCGLHYKIEPSFYYGSMYVAYALGVAVMVATTLVYWLLSDAFSVLTSFLWVLGVLSILGPFINGYSKIIWANFFFKYNPNKTL